MVSGYLPSSRDIMVTGTTGDERISGIDVWEKQVFSFGIDGVADVKVTGSRARIVEASGSATAEFDIPTFATASRWGELRLRVTERKIKLYKDTRKIYEKQLTVSVPDRVRLRIKVPDGYLRTTGIIMKKYYSGGGPCFENLCLYTGLESAARAEIWGLED